MSPIAFLYWRHLFLYAVYKLEHGVQDIYGIHAVLNVWNPRVVANDFSLSQIWLYADRVQQRNTIEVGWMVSLHLHRNVRNAGCQRHSCSDVDCPGFVITIQHVIDQWLPHVSVFDGIQYGIDVRIYQINPLAASEGLRNKPSNEHSSNDTKEASQPEKVNDKQIGYWPASLLPRLALGADTAGWGGEIIDKYVFPHPTSTQMGSGFFPSSGYKMATYISHLKYVDSHNHVVNPTKLIPYVTRRDCYDLQLGERREDAPLGVHFYFGGLGYNNPAGYLHFTQSCSLHIVIVITK
ncbi:hypothetical protein Cgig2_030918 [Carnegiea gigantea]|uniref:Neprosin PEP catalytic domain-containing protein n=1 Tax=Carnegiea gigantea TaxID=171969 RepID=A0A9Q1QJQ4_9CARY|nr:hypothetical protein Cgig2_030918 [Carnegiea gigantea]